MYSSKDSIADLTDISIYSNYQGRSIVNDTPMSDEFIKETQSFFYVVDFLSEFIESYDRGSAPMSVKERLIDVAIFNDKYLNKQYQNLYKNHKGIKSKKLKKALAHSCHNIICTMTIISRLFLFYWTLAVEQLAKSDGKTILQNNIYQIFIYYMDLCAHVCSSIGEAELDEGDIFFTHLDQIK
ncbi:hypothetical protein nvc1_085 [Namao virus]|nr:hypothetical protein nvc1_085 [Namao virus]